MSRQPFAVGQDTSRQIRCKQGQRNQIKQRKKNLNVDHPQFPLLNVKEYKNMITLQIDWHYDLISDDGHEKLICLCSSSSADCAASVLPNWITTFKIILIRRELNVIIADLQPSTSYYHAIGWKIKSGSCQKLSWFLLMLKEQIQRQHIH